MPAATRSTQYELRGFNHVALVCSDMQDTVDFYEGILGFPLVKTLDMNGHGQHFFFEVTENDGIAFFFFPNAAPQAPGIAAAEWLAGEMSPSAAGGLASKSAVGSMHHLSFDVPDDRLEEYRNKLIEAGIEVSEIVTQTGDDGKRMIRAFYFQDPDGVMLEFSAWSPVTSAPHFEPTRAADAGVRKTGRVAVAT
jgi:catechol 2,3-dioxygenase-like lactoylglutathione lyase family enzyme